MQLDNPILIPNALSFLTYRSWGAEVKGLRAFPRDLWPDNVPLLYFAYHIMVGLGTMMLALMALSLVLLRGGRLFTARPVLWMLMLALPFPYIATTAGWMTAEICRQPWLIYGLMRTAQGSLRKVSRRQRIVHADRFYGPVHGIGRSFFIPSSWAEALNSGGSEVEERRFEADMGAMTTPARPLRCDPDDAGRAEG